MNSDTINRSGRVPTISEFNEEFLPKLETTELTFRAADLLVKDTDPMVRGSRLPPPNVHFGQLKLLLSEILFLTMHWNPKTHPNPTLLYIGAAPGYHLGALEMLFPEFSYILYDGGNIRVPKAVEAKAKIFSGSVSGFFTNAEAQKYADRDDIFLVSDIRSGIDKTPDLTSEALIASDMYTQSGWVEIIRPVESLLKFRLPYYVKDIETLIQQLQNNYLQKLAGYSDRLSVPYLHGYVYKQCYAPKRSTELRLVPIRQDDKFVYRHYNIVDMQNKCNYFNNYIRPTYKYNNPATGKPGSAAPEYILDDYDGTATAFIFTAYLKRKGLPVTKKSLEDIISKTFDRMYTDMEAYTKISVTPIPELKETSDNLASMRAVHTENSIVNLRDLLTKKSAKQNLRD